MKSQTETAGRWHPATKLLLGAALLVVPYLLWTRPEAGSGLAAPASRTGSEDRPAAVAADLPSAALEPYALPPLERFAAVVERPLFSPTRRMPPLPEPETEPQAEPDPGPAPEPVAAGPEEPDLRFFGTVRQGGRAAALVTFPATNAVARLAHGDKVGEWEVLEVDRDRLLLGYGSEQRSFEIFGAGLRHTADGPAPEGGATAQTPAPPAAAEDPAADAFEEAEPMPDEPPYPE